MNVLRAAALRVLSCSHATKAVAVGSLKPRYLSSRACAVAQHHLNRLGVRSDLHPVYCSRAAGVITTAASPTLRMPTIQDHSSFANLSQAVVTHVDLGMLLTGCLRIMPLRFAMRDLNELYTNADLEVKFEQQVVQGSAKVCARLQLLQKQQGKPHKLCSCSSMLTSNQTRKRLSWIPETWMCSPSVMHNLEPHFLLMLQKNTR